MKSFVDTRMEAERAGRFLPMFAFPDRHDSVRRLAIDLGYAYVTKAKSPRPSMPRRLKGMFNIAKGLPGWGNRSGQKCFPGELQYSGRDNAGSAGPERDFQSGPR